jgi:superoxide dismutase, Cu-Zn family
MKLSHWKWANLVAFSAAAVVLVMGCETEPTTSGSSSSSSGAGGGGGQGGENQGGGGQGGTGGGMMGAKTAEATIASQSGSTITGTATFVEENGMVTLTVKLAGAAPGDHAVHIHMMGDCGMDGMNAMGHWNPDMKMHGKWGMGEFHLGDIGNVTVGADGTGMLTMSTNLWTVGDGSATNDVAGRAFMVHADPDDFVTQPTGNAGARVGCGVITKLP